MAVKREVNENGLEENEVACLHSSLFFPKNPMVPQTLPVFNRIQQFSCLFILIP